MANVTSNYTHDPIYELTQVTQAATTESYTHDPVGNRLSQVTTGSDAASVEYAYDSRDRLLTETGVTYSWDDNGNLVGIICWRTGDCTR